MHLKVKIDRKASGLANERSRSPTYVSVTKNILQMTCRIVYSVRFCTVLLKRGTIPFAKEHVFKKLRSLIRSTEAEFSRKSEQNH
jgi:hypothetical protein